MNREHQRRVEEAKVEHELPHGTSVVPEDVSAKAVREVGPKLVAMSQREGLPAMPPPPAPPPLPPPPPMLSIIVPLSMFEARKNKQQ